MRSVAVKNCTLVKDDGERVRVQPVCEKCGESRNAQLSIPVTPGKETVHHASCPNCGLRFEYVVETFES
ncbi:MAG: hypothetical protein K6F28_07000 [Lachnospiraceae bacterium]|nr:hypothetical protein [Lachnospiraceae bacterium]